MITWKPIICIEDMQSKRVLLVLQKDGVPDLINYDRIERIWCIDGNEVDQEYILETFTHYTVVNSPRSR